MENVKFVSQKYLIYFVNLCLWVTHYSKQYGLIVFETQKVVSYQCSDVIMSALASQVNGVSIVCSTICSKKASKHRVTGLCEENRPVTDGFPSQRASNAENASIWWRHHVHHAESIKSNIRVLETRLIVYQQYNNLSRHVPKLFSVGQGMGCLSVLCLAHINISTNWK